MKFASIIVDGNGAPFSTMKRIPMAKMTGPAQKLANMFNQAFTVMQYNVSGKKPLLMGKKKIEPEGGVKGGDILICGVEAVQPAAAAA